MGKLLVYREKNGTLRVNRSFELPQETNRTALLEAQGSLARMHPLFNQDQESNPLALIADFEQHICKCHPFEG